MHTHTHTHVQLRAAFDFLSELFQENHQRTLPEIEVERRRYNTVYPKDGPKDSPVCECVCVCFAPQLIWFASVFVSGNGTPLEFSLSTRSVQFLSSDSIFFFFFFRCCWFSLRLLGFGNTWSGMLRIGNTLAGMMIQTTSPWLNGHRRWPTMLWTMGKLMAADICPSYVLHIFFSPIFSLDGHNFWTLRKMYAHSLSIYLFLVEGFSPKPKMKWSGWGWLIGVESVPTWTATIKRIRRHLPAACNPPSRWPTPFDPLVVHYTLLGWLFCGNMAD